MFSYIFDYLTLDHTAAAALGFGGSYAASGLKALVSSVVARVKSVLAAAKALEAAAEKAAAGDLSTLAAAAKAPVAMPSPIVPPKA
jgi:hypothetical protein